jgi:cystathionine beta-lyase/cystathionine gamma-synthase
MVNLQFGIILHDAFSYESFWNDRRPSWPDVLAFLYHKNARGETIFFQERDVNRQPRSSQKIFNPVKHRLDHLGGSLDPHAAFLLHRGMKTLAVRVKYQNESTLKIARFLESHRAVARVNYPGLESHPRHPRARELFDGFGGVLSFELEGGVPAAERFMRHTSLPILAPSLGGVETLITRPATTSHSGMSSMDRQRLGITDSLIRLSVGIEATEEMIEDFDPALIS